MFLKNLRLTNYRNFKEVNLEFSQTTLLVGKNAQGKSNLLESVYFLSTTKSPKAVLDLQLIKKDEEVLRVEGLVEDGGESTQLEIVMAVQEGQLSKRVKVNGIGRRSLDYIGNLVVVLFSPEDIMLVVGSPSIRRWHIDLTLASVDREYKRLITEYSQVITNRNKVLKAIKEGIASLSELEFWNQQAVETGELIIQKRQDLFDFLNQTEKNMGDFYFDYKPSPISHERIREYLSREIASTSSLIGPHRDDFIFKFNNSDLAYFGSRGEQRTAVLDLKLSEVKFINEVKGSTPVLVLDDIFSELDHDHREYLVSISQGQQTIVSAIEGESIPAGFMASSKLVKVNNGEILSA